MQRVPAGATISHPPSPLVTVEASRDVAARLEKALPAAPNISTGFTIDDVTVGRGGLTQPLPDGSELPSMPGFLDARLVRLGTSGPGSYWEEGGYATWGVAYPDTASAADAFRVLTAEFQGRGRLGHAAHRGRRAPG